MENLLNKSVKLDLTTVDGNAFALMGAFRQQARREGWTKEEINIVLDECMKHDYDHLVATLVMYCEMEYEEDEIN